MNFTRMATMLYLILIICCWGRIVSTYPLDYNETNIEEADNALNEFLVSVLQPNFPSLLSEFQNQVLPISLDVYDKISKIHESYNYRLIEIEENAKFMNANLSECTETKKMPEVEELYSEYESNCEEVITNGGKNIVSVGYNKQQGLLFQKYNELMHYYKGCLAPADPIPHICAGVIAATLEEVRRITPLAKSYGFETDRSLKQEIVNLSECANGKISDSNKRIYNEFGKISNCILSNVIIV